MGNHPGNRGDSDIDCRTSTTKHHHIDPFSRSLKIIESSDDDNQRSDDDDVDSETTLCYANQNDVDYDRKCLTSIPLHCSPPSVSQQTQTNALETPTSDSDSLIFFTAKSNTSPTQTPISDSETESIAYYTFNEEDPTIDANKNITTTFIRRVSSISQNPAFETCLQTPILRLIKSSDSIRRSLRHRSLSSSLLHKLQKLSKLSVSRCEPIVIESKPLPATSNNNCACKGDFVDADCLRRFMEMSVTPAEYRGSNQLVTSTPIIGKDVSFDRGIFSIARKKKVDLHNLSPKVAELSPPETPPQSNRCQTNNTARITNGNNHQNLPKVLFQNASPITPTQSQQKQQLQQQQHQQANTMNNVSTPEDGNVLKKIVSFTLEQINNVDHSASTTTAESNNTTRPIFVPEKLNFTAYERFEGQILINWILSTISTDTLNERDTNDIQMLIAHICSNLLMAGVMKQITDNDDPLIDVFCPTLMYRWTYKENQHHQNQNVPKKLDTKLFHIQNNETTQISPPHSIADRTGYTTASTCLHSKKLFTIKSNIMSCNSITSIYAQMKSALIDIEEYARQNHIDLENCCVFGENELEHKDAERKKSCKEESIDCVDHAPIRLDFLDPKCVTTNGDKDDGLDCCDTNLYFSCFNSTGTQTDESTVVMTEAVNEKLVTEFEKQQANKKFKHAEQIDEAPVSLVVPKVPPIPPPMPMLFATTDQVETKAVAKNSSIPQPPPLPNFNLNSLSPNFSDSNNRAETNQSSIPIPPPFPNLAAAVDSSKTANQTSSGQTILSSNASSFCPPPPPMNGVLGPPPLPVPAAGNVWFNRTDTFRKSALLPPKPMITLFWTRIVAPKPEQERQKPVDEALKTEDTAPCKTHQCQLWQEIDETKLDNLDEFTELFSRQAVAPKKAKESVKPTRIRYVKVLDNKRSQSVGIFAQSLHRLHLDFQVIEHAIYHCDTSVVSLDLMQQLLEHKATAQELEMIRDAASAQSDIPLDGPEQFLLKLSKISCSSERIACLLFEAEFDESSNLISSKVETVQSLCEFLMDNDHLKLLFSIILTLGNYMNGGNRMRGQADGFGLDVLGKLRDVKSKDKKVTLLHFIVKTYIEKYRQKGLQLHEIALPVPNVIDVNRAAIIDFVELNEQINHIKRRILDFEKKMKVIIQMSTDENLQPFKNRAKAFVASASSRINEQCQRLKTSRTLFRKTLGFYKFIPKSGTIDECTPGQFFELWSSFVADFHDIWKKEHELLLRVKNVSSPKTVHDKSLSKGKSKPSGLRMRRVNQL